MDNAYILLLLVKKQVNLAFFISCFEEDKDFNYCTYYDHYDEEYHCCTKEGEKLSLFEFQFLTSFLRLRGELK